MPLLTKSSYLELSVLTGVSLLAFIIRSWIERKRRWIEVGRVEQLWLYPMKSAKGHSVMKFDCYPVSPKCGWIFDRRFLLVNKSGAQVTSKDESQLVLVTIDFPSKNEVTFSAPDMSLISLSLKALLKKGRMVLSNFRTRLGIEVETLDCGSEVADWFCQFCKKPPGSYRLRYHSEELKPRNLSIDPKEGDRFAANDIGTLVKLSPYMLMNEASVGDLSKRTAETASDRQWEIQRFRPNIVVTGPEAYDEDDWRTIQIGESAKFKNVRNCTRCTVTAIDPATGKMNEANEPLTTLKKYRLGDDKQRAIYKNIPMLGIHLTLMRQGRVRIGDPVKVLYSG